jgi:hypothetical protein
VPIALADAIAPYLVKELLPGEKFLQVEAVPRASFAEGQKAELHGCDD